MSKPEDENSLDNWIDWLSARIPQLKGSGAYRFWLKQSFRGYYNERIGKPEFKLKEAELYDLMNQHHREEISFSRMCEIINEKFNS